MPFFSRKSKKNMSTSPVHVNAKAKLEHKLYVAENCPEPIFDLSSCSLHEIPYGVFSLCKVLRKELLCLQDNKLSRLDDDGLIENLKFLTNLQLQSNRFSNLPSDVGFLSNLKVLNVANNKLKSLPATFTNLKSLQQLNLSCNKFTDVPSVVCSITSLQSLNLTGNKIKILPSKLCYLQSLHSLDVDITHLVFPKSDVVQEGTEAIMKFLCAESGKDYVQPNVCLSSDAGFNEQSNCHGASTSGHNQEIMEKLDQYEEIQEEKRQKNLLYEQQLEQSELSQIRLFNDASLKNQKLLLDFADENNKLEEQVMKVQSSNENSRRVMLQALNSIEKKCNRTIEDLLKKNELRKNTDLLMDQLEKDRIDIEDMLEIKHEEADQLRKKDVLAAMQTMLVAEAEIQHLYENYYKQDITPSPDEINNEDEEKELMRILRSHDDDQKELVSDLLMQEKYQKEAFESLFMDRDDHRNDIINQISMVQTELASVSAMELKSKDLNQQIAMEVLTEKRETLAGLLEQLTVERYRREKDIRSQLKLLDERHSLEEENYWLIQYQRLMEKKPKRLTVNINMVDDRVQSILDDAGANDFLPIFASRNISLDAMLNMNDVDLIKLGVTDASIREAILKNISLFVSDESGVMPTAPVADTDEDQVTETVTSSAAAAAASVTTITANINKMWIEAECVICLDNKSDVVFLLCGHVCSCRQCSLVIDVCPLCRNEISRKLPIFAELT